MTEAASKFGTLPSADVRSAVEGRLIAPGAAELDKSRAVFVGGLDRRPAVIVHIADAKGVGTGGMA